MDMHFCRRCGTPLRNTNGHVYTCEKGHTVFANASPASFIWIINDKNEVLVIVRAQEPGLGLLDAPGGFNDGAETYEEGLAREVEEEVGLTPADYSKPQYILTYMDTYNYKEETIDVLSGAFWARTIGTPTVTALDDAAKAYFIPISEIDPKAVYFTGARESLAWLQDHLSSLQKVL